MTEEIYLSKFSVFDPKFTLTRKDDGKKFEKIKMRGVRILLNFIKI